MGLTVLDVVYSIKISLRKISTQCLKKKINIFIVQNTTLFILLCSAAAKSLQSCPTLCDPIVCSPPGSLVYGIFRAKAVEWGAIAFSEGTMLSKSLVQFSVDGWSCVPSQLYLGQTMVEVMKIMVAQMVKHLSTMRETWV